MCNSSFEKEKEVSGAERNLEIRACSFGVYRPNPEVRNVPPPPAPLAPSPMSCRPGWLLLPCARGARAHVLVHRHTSAQTPSCTRARGGRRCCRGVLLHAGARCRRMSPSPARHSSGSAAMLRVQPGAGHRPYCAHPPSCPAWSCVPSWGPLGGQEAVVGDGGAVPPPRDSQGPRVSPASAPKSRAAVPALSPRCWVLLL